MLPLRVAVNIIILYQVSFLPSRKDQPLFYCGASVERR
jgi:hypothetical protein